MRSLFMDFDAGIGTASQNGFIRVILDIVLNGLLLLLWTIKALKYYSYWAVARLTGVNLSFQVT